MAMKKVEAEVISMPGQLGDVAYSALQLNIEGFQGPYVLTLALPAMGYRALAKQVDPLQLYEAIAGAVNVSTVRIDIPD